MNKRVVVLSVVVLPLIASCAATMTENREEILWPRWLPDTTTYEGLTLSELSQMFEIVDFSWWDCDLRLAPSPKKFVSRVEKYRFKMNRWQNGLTWDELIERFRYAKSICGSPIDTLLAARDVRWPYLLRLGLPSAYWTEPYEAIVEGNVDTVLTFFNWWSDLDTGMACQALRSEDTYPGKLLNAKIPPSDTTAKPIYPELLCFEFPEVDSIRRDVWVVGMVRVDDLTHKTVLDKIKVALEVYAGKTIVYRESQERKFGIGGLIYVHTANKEALMIPFSFQIPALPDGNYVAELRVSGSRMNSGKGKLKFFLPSPYASPGLSDIVLLSRNPTSGNDILKGIQRQARNLVPTSPIINIGDTISAYAEINFPAGNDWAYTSTIFLQPTRRGRPTVKIGKLRVHADSLGNPIVMWGGTKSLSEKTEFEAGLTYSDRGFQFIFAKVEMTKEKNVCIFEASFRASSPTPGDYWLILEVNGKNSNGDSFIRETRRRISIKSPVSVFGSR